MKASGKHVATTGITAALYAVMVQVFHPISFLQINIRIANALLGLIPLMGWPAILGISIGVLIGNLTSPLGPIDLLSFLPTFLGCYIIYLLRKSAVSVILGLFVYSVIISAWVSFMLWYVLKLPYLLSFLYVLVGSLISNVLMGFLLYKALSKLPLPLLK